MHNKQEYGPEPIKYFTGKAPLFQSYTISRPNLIKIKCIQEKI
jgi:hypothetical protein